MLAAIRRFCRQATPPPLDREVVVEMTVRDNFVTIWERRPPPGNASNEWTRMHAVQMRYNPAYLMRTPSRALIESTSRAGRCTGV
jgi:hypothetical protein